MEHLDMSGHGQYFEGGESWKPILFAGWTPHSTTTYYWSLAAVVVLGFFYEALRHKIRPAVYSIVHKHETAAKKWLADHQAEYGGRTSSYTAAAGDGDGEAAPIKWPRAARAHTIDSILYGIQVTVGYWLMLVAMTYNIGLFLAVVLGLTLGFFSFSRIGATLDQAESTCC